jgi:hypothetical protein
MSLRSVVARLVSERKFWKVLFNAFSFCFETNVRCAGALKGFRNTSLDSLEAD